MENEESNKTDKYRFFKSSKEGMADVFQGINFIALLPYNTAEEFCVSANTHFSLSSKVREMEAEAQKNLMLYDQANQQKQNLEAENERLKELLFECDDFCFLNAGLHQRILEIKASNQK